MFNLDITKTNLGLPEVWEFEVVTPLFIGSGEKLRADTYDFQFSDGRFYYVDYTKFFEPGTLKIRNSVNYKNAGLIGSPCWDGWNKEPIIIEPDFDTNIQKDQTEKSEVKVIEKDDDPYKTAVLQAQDPEALGDAIGMGEVKIIAASWNEKKKNRTEAMKLLNRIDITKQCPRLPKDYDGKIPILKYWQNLQASIAASTIVKDSETTSQYSTVTPDCFKGLNELHTFIRNGYGQPYIPGSSLKGVFRTILRANRNELIKLPISNESRLDSLIRDGLRNNPTGDLGKVFQVSDGNSSVKDLGLFKVKVFSKSEQAIPINVEALRIGSRFCIRTKIELSPLYAKKFNKLSPKSDDVKFLARELEGDKSWKQLKTFIRVYTERIASYQERVIRKRGFAQVADWLCNNVLKDPGKYIQIGFGSGWSSMTGIPALSNINNIDQIAASIGNVFYGRRLRNTRYDGRNVPFPLSFRVVEVNGKWLPMGWVRIIN